MNCKEFKDNVIDYIEFNLDREKAGQIEGHMKSCSACRELYFRRVESNKGFDSYLSSSEVVFSSQRVNIMNRIDTKKYNRGIFTLLGFHLRRNNIRYALCSLAVVFIFTVSAFMQDGSGSDLLERGRAALGLNVDKDKEIEEDYEDTIEAIDKKLQLLASAEEAHALLASSDPFAYKNYITNTEEFKYIVTQGDLAVQRLLLRVAANDLDFNESHIAAIAISEITGQDIMSFDMFKGWEWLRNYATEEDSSIRKKLTGPIDVRVESIDEINPTGDGVSALVTGKRRTELADVLKELKNMELGVGPWRIIYVSKDKILFYNYSHLLAYNSTEEYKGIYNAIDLRKIDVGTYQGSNATQFYISPDGRYCMIGASGSGQKDVYLFDLESNKYHIIAKGDRELGNIDNWLGWMQWLISDQQIYVYNTETEKYYNPSTWEELTYDRPKDLQLIQNVEGRLWPHEVESIIDYLGSNFAQVIFNGEERSVEYSVRDYDTIVAVVDKGPNYKLGNFSIIEIDLNTMTGRVIFEP
jgi:hypothetical protein